MSTRLCFAMGLAVASHLLSAMFPFVAAAGMKALGIFPACFVFYAVSTCLVMFVGIASRRCRNESRSSLKQLGGENVWPKFFWAIYFFACAGGCYYLGLAIASNKLEFMFLTRLDWIIQMPVVVLFLREVMTRRNLLGAVIAALGGIVIGWTGALGLSGVLYAVGYVGASVCAYTLVRSLFNVKPASSGFMLMAIRNVAMMLVFAILMAIDVATLKNMAATNSSFMLVLVAGTFLFFLFWARFEALRAIPLWLFAALAPLQTVGGVIIAFAVGELLSSLALTGVCLVSVGELIIAYDMRRQLLQAGQA
ncbi:MAG: hypothetical protein IT292_00935 [Deltaproteobacteria bacterium]|nr:hypothetical protein [Deltaproteobacteria bacterium]